MLSLCIPIGAVIAMGTKTLEQVYSQLMSTQSVALIDVLTFGYINTPIIENATGRLEAYVTYWLTDVVTVCKVEGQQCHLLGSRHWDHVPSKAESEDLWKKPVKPNGFSLGI